MPTFLFSFAGYGRRRAGPGRLAARLSGIQPAGGKGGERVDFQFSFGDHTLLIVSVIFLERKKPSEAAAWLLLLILMPGFGFIIYALLGDTISMKISKTFHRKNELDLIYNNMVCEQLDLMRHKEAALLGDPFIRNIRI